VFIPLAISDIEAIGMQSGNIGTGTLIPQGMHRENAALIKLSLFSL
jgi:hypothetical protein